MAVKDEIVVVKKEVEVVTKVVAVKEVAAIHPNPIIALAIAQAAERFANETR